MNPEHVYLLSGGFLLLSFLLCLCRFIRGPSSLDRVLALDLIGILTVSSLGLVSLYNKSFILMNISLVFGLVSFVSALAFGYYFYNERRKA